MLWLHWYESGEAGCLLGENGREQSRAAGIPFSKELGQKSWSQSAVASGWGPDGYCCPLGSQETANNNFRHLPRQENPNKCIIAKAAGGKENPFPHITTE